jgi:YD repeat-containing protein
MKTHLKLISSLALTALAIFGAPAQTTNTPYRWSRGTDTNSDASYLSWVGSLDGEIGSTNAPSLMPTLTNDFGLTGMYHLNSTNTASQTNLANRIQFTNAIVSFGSKYAGNPLYYGQPYHFVCSAGAQMDPSRTWFITNSIMITVHDKTTGNLTAVYQSTPPDPSNPTSWTAFMQGGAASSFLSIPGLTITYSQADSIYPWSDFYGATLLTFVADSTTSNSVFTFWIQGTTSKGDMVLASAPGGLTYTFLSPLFTLDFDQRPPWQATFVSQPQFQGQPMPAQYEGKSLTELLAVQAVVTNTVLSAATNWLDLDNSPELREHPTLDQFVTDMGSNALALASYVQNQIELCDAVAYNNTTNIADTSINLGGVNRGALATFMEGQGSPVEQDALLIYLLRKAGVPAAYIYAPYDGVQMLDTRLSMLLQMQIKGAVNASGQIYTTNSLISVNYPWVAAYVNGQWVHLFPWLKNTAVTEGLNLYDYMPTNYNNGYKWIRQYLTGDTNIFSLNPESDTVSTLFPLFVQNALLTTAPGISLEDIGTTVVNRQVEYNKWSDFPTPFAVTNGAVTTVHDLTSITTNSGFSTWTNIFDTVSVQVFSQAATNKSLFTGDLRTVDLHNRKFLIRHQATNGGNYTLILSLAPFRPAATNTTAFTNDSNLLNHEQLSMTLATTDDNLTVQFTRKRHQTLPAAVAALATNTYGGNYLGFAEQLTFTSDSTLRLGDTAAICMHAGRVSKPMLAVWAQEYWTMQQEVKANPSLTNTISPDILQGTLPYLMGMSYYERISSFNTQIANLHKVRINSTIAEGLSKLSAERNTSGTLLSPLTLYHPNVDMFFQDLSAFGNQGLRPDEGDTYPQTVDDFMRLSITEASAQEHAVIEDFYNEKGAISSVRLILQAQQPGQPGMLELNVNNYASHSSLSSQDANIWTAITNAFQTATAPIATNFVNVFVTAAQVLNTNVSYKGMGALIYGVYNQSALISNNQLPQNGAYGLPFTEPFYNPPDYNNIDLSFNTSANNSWAVTYSAPTFSAPAPLPDLFNSWDAPTIFNNFSDYTYGGPDLFQQQAFTSASADLGYTGTEAAAASYADTVNNGADYDAHIGDQYAQLDSGIGDPVNSVTGEFYIDTTDLTLPGPMPLFIRRNYSSQNVDLGDSTFGYGWRPAYTPYLRVVTNNVIFAAEMDGTVVAYRQPTPGTNLWKPLPADNPQLNNRSSVGMGSTANLFNNYITSNTAGGNTNFVLNGADGSVRVFQYTNYPITGTNTFNRYRPYLQTWTDANSNSYTFSYETDSTQPDYGLLTRVQSSNGNFLGFYYDSFAHITQAYTEDGRRLTYDYDNNGDLLTVTFPDESQINYVYQHTNSVTNSVTNFFSTHLITQEQKPDGRVLANTYDSLRRVITQAATVGSDLNLVTNALFTYSNNFTNLTNTIITGTTYIVDVFGHTNTYQYTSNQITSITDQLNQTISQTWYSNTNDTGYYPHSLKAMTDKRGLNTGYQYDTNGNLAQVVLTGNLTGTGLTNETATYSFTYTNRNLIATASNPSTNQVAFTYGDSSHPMLPTSVVKLASGTPVSTNLYFYTNVSQVVTNGAVVATNSTYGLVREVIRGGFASNTFLYDGRGFMTQSTRYTGTADPAVTATLFFDDRGELAQRTDAAGRSLTFGYDGMGRLTEEEAYESGAGISEGWNFLYYTENGELQWTDGSRYNPEDYVWRDYDGAGRKITEMHWRSEANPSGGGVQTPAAATNLYATTFYQYDTFNNLTKVTDPLGNYTTNQYDNLGQLTNSVNYSAAGVALATNQYRYEPGGKISLAVNPLGGVTTKSYTSAGKLMAQVNADSSTNGWTYYLDGRLHKEFLPNGNYWETIYNDPN